jgi:hypothetical protein
MDSRKAGADEGASELAGDSDQQDEAEFREPGQADRRQVDAQSRHHEEHGQQYQDADLF